MTLLSRLLSRMAHLPPAETPHMRVERDLKATMSDGVELLADRYAPHSVENPPLILVRCCYGRRGFFGLLYGRLYAERGFQVVNQSTRGTFGSGGTFKPFDEHDDSLAGHRIRLEVSSSNYPRFDRNTNTGELLRRRPRRISCKPSTVFTMMPHTPRI